MRLLGYHVNATKGGIPEFIMGAQPSTVVVLNGNADWGSAIDSLRDTHWVWRGFKPTEPNFEGPMNTKAEAKKYAEWSLARMNGVRWDFAIGANEPIVKTADGMKRLAEFECERARILRDNGYGAAIGTFSVGNPGNMGLLKHFIPAIEAVHEYKGVLSLHQYGYPRDLKRDASWLILRHRKFYNGEPSQGWDGLPSKYRNTPLIITETGGDQLIYSTTPGGWQWYMDENEYISHLLWLDNELAKDAYVLGAAIYCCGNNSSLWVSYDVWEKTARKIATQRQPMHRKPQYVEKQAKWALGVDVSWWQKESIDWKQTDFAFVRASYRLSKDSRFEMHYGPARAEGIPVGMYHYLYSDAPMAKQARFFSTLVNEYKPDLPPAVDIEEETLTRKQVREFITTFRTINKYPLMVYTSRSKWSKIVGANADWAKCCLLWVADWGPREEPLLPDIWPTWEFWQYTSNGRIQGYTGRIDMNRFRGDRAQFLEKYGAV